MLQTLQKKPYGYLYQGFYIPAILIITALLYFFCDQSVSVWISQNHEISDLYKGLTHFAHGIELSFDVKTLLAGFFLALLGMRLCKYQGFFYQVALIIFLLLIFNNILAYFVKHLMGKVRPAYFLAHGDFGFKFFQSNDTFLSFPSGHAIDIMTIASVFMFVYPRFRAIIFAFAILFCLSRVWYLKHFLSDVFFGSALVFISFPVAIYLLEQLSHYHYGRFIKPALELFKTKKLKGNKK